MTQPYNAHLAGLISKSVTESVTPSGEILIIPETSAIVIIIPVINLVSVERFAPSTHVRFCMKFLHIIVMGAPSCEF